MSGRVRFGLADGSTTGVVITGPNALNQMRQFAFDGRKYFYQHKKDGPFIEVNPRDIPNGNKTTLDEKWVATRS